jgi:hypothetical protein
MSTGWKCSLFRGHFYLVDIYVSLPTGRQASMSIKKPFFDQPEHPQDTPEIACFPTLDAYFGRVDPLCPNPKSDGHGHRFF